jgi:hypothetical protein
MIDKMMSWIEGEFSILMNKSLGLIKAAEMVSL